jgi:hypothetical protein
VVASWVFGVLGPASILVPVIPVVLIFMRRPWAAVVCVLLSPLGVGFANGVVRYCRGEAYILYEGLPGTQSHNLDRELRCEQYSSGCLISGNEWLNHGPNNAAVRLMTRWFGPEPGTYRGPYPTEAEALAAVAGGQAVPVADVRSDAIRVGDRVVRLDAGVGTGLLRAGGADYDAQYGLDQAGLLAVLGPIRAVVWRDSCLIIRVPTATRDDKGVQSGCVAVCDVGTGRPFAYFAEGEYHHRVPPVMWRR